MECFFWRELPSRCSEKEQVKTVMPFSVRGVHWDSVLSRNPAKVIPGEGQWPKSAGYWCIIRFPPPSYSSRHWEVVFVNFILRLLRDGDL